MSAPAPGEAGEAGLRRRLGRLDVTMIVVGSCIGSGVFLSAGDVVSALSFEPLVLGVWVLGGLMTLAGALTYAELGAMMPRAGGVYVFLTEAYGELVGFLYGWANLLVITSGSVAALAVACATYAGYFVPLGPVGSRVFALVALALVTVVNVVGVKAGARMTNVLTTLKLAAIGFVVIVGLVLGSSSTTDFGAVALPAHPAPAVAAALVGVLWAYGGWQHVTMAAGETKRPTRDVPLALVAGAAIVTAVYLLTNVAYARLLSPPEMVRAQSLAAQAVATRTGVAGGRVIAFAVMLSTLGTAGIFTLTAPRMYFAMASRGLFFPAASRVDPRTGTPVLAIVCQSVWSGVLAMFWGTFNSLITYVLITEWIFFALTGAAVFVLRRTRPGVERPYRVPGYPVTPAFFVGVAAWFVVNAFIGRPLESAAGVAFLLLGVPVFLFWKRVRAPRD
jgi:APA family basic amino acid/polyamine antiporter